MPRLRSLPEQAVMRDLYRTHPGTCKPLGELTEAAMRGPSPFTQAQRELIAALCVRAQHVYLIVTARTSAWPRPAASRPIRSRHCSSTLRPRHSRRG